MRPEACNPFLAERKHVIFKNIQGKILGGFLGRYEHIFQLGRDADYICVVSGGKYLSPPLFFVVMMEEFLIFARSTVNGEPNQPRKREKYKFHKSTRGEGGNVGELFAKSFFGGYNGQG
jgi:hypothetical protein